MIDARSCYGSGFRLRWLAAISIALMMIAAGVDSAMAANIRVYSDVDYHGKYMTYLDARPDLRGSGFNNKISSLRVENGSWLFCSDTNYKGDCFWVSRDWPDLSTVGFNNRISSLRPEPGGIYRFHWGDKPEPSLHSLVLFEEKQYHGDWVAVPATVTDLAAAGMNGKISSLVVRSGVWRLCTLANFQGRCLVVAGSAWDLSAIFSGRVRSIQLVRR